MARTLLVRIGLDEDVPDYMEGIIRVGSVEFLDENERSIDVEDYEEFGIYLKENDLIDNEEFFSEAELRTRIAERLNINEENVIID